MALWGGRFQHEADPLFRRFNDSLRYDRRLLPQDIEGSIAWAAALARAGVLTEPERARTADALADILKEWGDRPDDIAATGHEDIHSFVEAELIRRVGDLGKKLHTGRSRNDQVATDLRLWTRAQIGHRRAELRQARAALLDLARREEGVVLPGYTHLQRAQPVLLPHWALSYFEMLSRDDERFADAARRMNRCPLGAAALAGSAFPIDRDALARDLGFDGPALNSIDAVSDRDFALDTLAAASACALHLSRLAEDLIIYSSGEFAFVQLSDAVTSGSSIMPQKKNPDALELIRARSGRVLGSLVTLSVVLKGLPSAYNKDLQEDKEPLFDAMDTLSACLRMLTPVLSGARFDAQACLRAARGGHANATELADYLAEKGVPFREAHEIVGRIVRAALERGAALDDLPLEDLRRFHPLIGSDVFQRISMQTLLARRNILGGAGPDAVRRAIEDAARRLEPER